MSGDQRVTELYARIDRLWRETDLPAQIRETPGWQGAWRLLWDWYFARVSWPEPLYGGPPCDPGGRPATWSTRIHIWSHELNSDRDHSVRHAEIEDEAERLILQWWDEQKLWTTPKAIECRRTGGGSGAGLGGRVGRIFKLAQRPIMRRLAFDQSFDRVDPCGARAGDDAGGSGEMPFLRCSGC